MRKKLLLLALVLFVTLLSVGAYLIKYGEEEMKGPVAFSNYSFNPPMTLSYDVIYESEGEMKLSNMIGEGVSDYKIKLIGNLKINLLKIIKNPGSNLYDILLVMDGLSGNLNVSDEELTAGALGRIEARAIVDSFGMIKYFRRTENTLKLSGNILKSFLSVWPVSLPRDSKGKLPLSWRESENSFFGKVDSLYELKKYKTEIEDAFDMISMPCSDDLVGESGSFVLVNRSFKFNPAGKVEIVLSLDPVISVALKADIEKEQNVGDVVGGHYSTNIEMTLVSRGVFATSSIIDPIDPAKYDDNALLTEDKLNEEIEKQFLEKIVGNLTLEEIAVMVADFEKRQVEHREITEFYLKIKAFVTMNSDDLSEIQELLLEAAPNSLLMELLSSALSSSRNEDALDVLLQVVKKRSGESSLIQRLIPLLVLGGVVTSKSQDYLIKLARKDKRDEIRTTTDLALGIAARSLVTHDSRRSKNLVDRAIKNFKRARGADEKRLRLQELGNTGSPAILAPIKPMLDSDDSDVRADAIFQLRFVESPDAEEILLRFLDDSSNEVRKSVSKTFSFRKPSSKAISAFMTAFSKEEDDNVRYMIVKSIWQGRHENPKVRAFVENISSNDSAERVRVLAKSLL